MAGFMTVLAAADVRRYAGRVLNTHPSLLPAFPGAHAVRDALGLRGEGHRLHGPHRHGAHGRRADPGPGGRARAARTTPRRRCTSGSRRSSAASIPPWCRGVPGMTARPAVRLRQDRRRRAGAGAARARVGAGVERRHGRGHRRRRPARHRRGRPHRRRRPSSATGSSRCTRRSTAASWPTSTDPTHVGRPGDATASSRSTSSSSTCTRSPTQPGIELIDVGGPAMVRAAAKNHAHVGVVVDPRRLRPGARRAAPPAVRCRRRPAGAWPARRSPTPRPTTPPIVTWFDGEADAAGGEVAVHRRCLPADRSHLAARAGPGAALRREPAPAGRPLPGRRRPVVVGRRRAARRQGAVVPQPVRHRGGVAPGPPLRRDRPS